MRSSIAAAALVLRAADNPMSPSPDLAATARRLARPDGRIPRSTFSAFYPGSRRATRASSTRWIYPRDRRRQAGTWTASSPATAAARRDAEDLRTPARRLPRCGRRLSARRPRSSRAPSTRSAGADQALGLRDSPGVKARTAASRALRNSSSAKAVPGPRPPGDPDPVPPRSCNLIARARPSASNVTRRKNEASATSRACIDDLERRGCRGTHDPRRRAVYQRPADSPS